MKQNIYKVLKTGDLVAIKKFIASGEDINQRDESGTPLLLNSLSGYNVNHHIVLLLIDLKANVNIKDDKGDTPLKLAVKCNFYEIAQKLLVNGAKPNLKDIEGNSALIYALHNRNEDMVRLLVQYGADVNILDKNGNIPLFNLLSENHVVRYDMIILLIELGANTNFKSNLGTPVLNVAVINDYTLITEKLLEAKANPNCKDKTSNSPLYLALNNRNEDMVRLLVKNNAEVDQLDKEGNSLLLNLLSENYGVRYDMIILLIKLGANVSLANNFGITPLFIAIDKQLIAITENILRCGIDPNSKNIKGKSPLNCAVEKSNYQLVKLLVDAGANSKNISSENLEITNLLCNNAPENVDNFFTNLSGNDTLSPDSSS